MTQEEASSYARSLIEASLDPLVTISADGKIMDVNVATEKITGIHRNKLIGSNFSVYFTDPHKAEDGYQLAFSRGVVRDYPLAICHTSGNITPVLYNATVYRDKTGKVAGIFAAARDITALKKAREDLEETISLMRIIREMSDLLQSCQYQEEAYPIITKALSSLLLETKGSLYISDNKKQVMKCVGKWGNHTVEEYLPPEECWAMRRGHIHISGYAHSLSPRCKHILDDSHPYACISLFSHTKGLGLISIRFERPETQERTFSKIMPLVEASADSIRLALANLALMEKLRESSLKDPLTGLYNRRYLEQTLGRELLRVHRSGKSLCVAMLDIDNFKKVNDSYGHGTGDDVLKTISSIINNFRFGSDIVCRYGGEEFVIVLADINPNTASEILAHLRAEISNTKILVENGSSIYVTVSIGYSFYPIDGRDQNTLISAADKALYSAKRTGKNKVVAFS